MRAAFTCSPACAGIADPVHVLRPGRSRVLLCCGADLTKGLRGGGSRGYAPHMADILTAAQSEKRVRELEAQGYTVTREVQPDGSVIVYKSSANLGWVLMLLGLGGCFLFARGRR